MTRLQRWHNAINHRAGWRCEYCGNYVEPGTPAHHILEKGKSQYPHLKFDLNNGVCLCPECHTKVTFQPNFEQMVWDELDLYEIVEMMRSDGYEPQEVSC